MSGFEAKYRLSGAGFTIKNVLNAGTIAVTKGDMVTLAAGQFSRGVPGTAGGYLGVSLATSPGAVTATRFPIITDTDVVYSVADANVRKIGDILSLGGGTATGTHHVQVSAGHEFVVVEDSRSDEATKVVFNTGKHIFNTKQ